MQIKLQLGKLRLQLPLSEIIATQQETNHLEILPVHLHHVMALEILPMYHKDPFDRLLGIWKILIYLLLCLHTATY